jgi:hypothetical protein
VAVSEHRPDRAELEGLARVHGVVVEWHPRLHFDGTHLTWSDLHAGPGACAPAAFTHEGCFHPSGTFAIDPVTWHELVGHGLPLRGPALAGRPIWTDNAVLRAWTLRNLVEYWKRWATRLREGPSALDGDHALVCWGVLRVARLHYTVTTEGIVSKTAAGQSALWAFKQSDRIVWEALWLRADPTLVSHYAALSERRAAVVDLVASVMDSGLRVGAADSVGSPWTGPELVANLRREATSETCGRWSFSA